MIKSLQASKRVGDLFFSLLRVENTLRSIATALPSRIKRLQKVNKEVRNIALKFPLGC